MICPRCNFDYTEKKKPNERIVIYTYNSYGLKSILRIRLCPHCGHLSLTEEKHTGQTAFPRTIERREPLTLKQVITNNIDVWIKNFPNEKKLIERLRKAVK